MQFSSSLADLDSLGKRYSGFEISSAGCEIVPRTDFYDRASRSRIHVTDSVS